MVRAAAFIKKALNLECVLDQVEVRRIGRQVAQRRAGGRDHKAHVCAFMGGQVVQDDCFATLAGC